MKLAAAPRSSSSTDTDIELTPLDATEISDRIQVMRKQEDTVYFCIDYLKKEICPQMIDKLCRSKMLKWCFQVADCGLCQRETVVVAISYLDRFLSSGMPRAIDVIKTRSEYQLASMTTLYMAIKLMEQVEIDTADLVTLCGNSFTAKDFAQMEYDILSALNWRVHGPTIISFLEHFFALIPTATSIQNNTTWRKVVQISKQYTELILGDFYFVTEKPSTCAIAIISNSLKHIPYDLLNKTDFLSQIMSVSKIDLGLQEIILATKRVASISNEISFAETIHPRRDSIKMLSSKTGDCSPTCITTQQESSFYS